MSNPISPRLSPIDIQPLLAEFDARGQSAAAFARSRGVAIWRLSARSERSIFPTRAVDLGRIIGVATFPRRMLGAHSRGLIAILGCLLVWLRAAIVVAPAGPW